MPVIFMVIYGAIPKLQENNWRNRILDMSRLFIFLSYSIPPRVLPFSYNFIFDFTSSFIFGYISSYQLLHFSLKYL